MQSYFKRVDNFIDLWLAINHHAPDIKFLVIKSLCFAYLYVDGRRIVFHAILKHLAPYKKKTRMIVQNCFQQNLFKKKFHC